MIQAAQLVAKVAVEGDSEAKSKLSSVSKKVDDTSHGFKDMLKGALSFAAGNLVFNAAGNALGFLKDQLGQAFQQSMDAQAGMADTVNVLKSTRDVSGMTANAVADLATKYSHLTKFQDDTIQSGENMLLTFTNIGKKVFPDATVSMLDLSQKMGGDVKGAAIELGKALNDPVAGITALQRVGVTFSLSQKDAIKQMMAHGDIAKAQGLILKELHKEFGGTAEAAGKTFGGQLAILNQRLDDVRQNIGDKLLPIVTSLVGWISTTGVSDLNMMSDWFINVGLPALQQFGGEVEQNALPILQSVGSWIENTAIPDFLAFSGWFQDTAMPVIKQTGNTVKNDFLPPLKSLIGALGETATNFQHWLDKGGGAKMMLNTLAADIKYASSVLSPLVGWLGQFVGWMNKGGPATDLVKLAIVGVGAAMVGVKVVAFGKSVFDTFNTMTGHVNDFIGTVGKIKDKLGDVLDFFKNKFGPEASASVEGVGKASVVTATETESIGTAAVASETEVAASTTSMDAELVGVGTSAKGASLSVAGVGAAALGILGTLSAVAAVAFAEFSVFKWIKDQGWIADAPKTGPDWITHQNLHQHAAGTNFAPGGMSLVGERGPEILNIPRGSQIIPNNQIGSMSNSGRTINLHLTLQTNGRTYARAILPDIVNEIRSNTGAKI